MRRHVSTVIIFLGFVPLITTIFDSFHSLRADSTELTEKVSNALQFAKNFRFNARHQNASFCICEFFDFHLSDLRQPAEIVSLKPFLKGKRRRVAPQGDEHVKEMGVPTLLRYSVKERRCFA